MLVSAAEKNDAYGTFRLAECFQEGFGCKKNMKIAAELMERAADLGEHAACRALDRKRDSRAAERVKYLICCFDMYSSDWNKLCSVLEDVLSCHAKQFSCGDVILEVGEALKGEIDEEKETVFGEKQSPYLIEVMVKVVEMCDIWCSVAREACVAWGSHCKANGIEQGRAKDNFEIGLGDQKRGTWPCERTG